VRLDRRPLGTEQANREPTFFQRLVVVGASGSGKTTLANKLAQCLEVPHVELDALYWNQGWVPAPRDVFRERVAQALSGDAWATDGNYRVVRDIVWSRADTLVWLDYSLPVVMGRIIWRTLRRLVVREELWNGNRETFVGVFLSRDSIFLYTLRTYFHRRREYPELLSRPEHARLNVVHLRSPGATREWIETWREHEVRGGMLDRYLK
jgi:adenylate kinase family enzyme